MTYSCEIFQKDNAPEDFNPKFVSVGCFIKNLRDSYLVLERQEGKSFAKTWGLPSGKVNEGELMYDAMTREIQEETGISIDSADINRIATIGVRYEEYDFTYHIFVAQLDNTPQVQINPEEHSGFQWVSLSSILKLPMIPGFTECIEILQST